MTTTVAIIEDKPEFLAHFAQIIRAEAEFTLVGTASNGADGIALVDRIGADVYLVDLGLPDMSGTEVIKHAIRTCAECDVLVITVFGDDAHIIESVEAGATGYVLKDSSAAEIVDCIRTLRAGGSPVSPVIARKLLQRFRLESQGAIAPAVDVPAAASTTKAVLTQRETEILSLLSKGLSFSEIGESLHISSHTVAQHIKKIYRKLAVHSRGEAVYEATQMGILQY